MSAPMGGDSPSSTRGRLSRRQAMSALAAVGFGAGLASGSPPLAAADGCPQSTQLNPDGTTPFNFHLAASEPVNHEAGSFRMVTLREMPRIDGLSIHLVDIAPGGIREVHWHPNAAEINYVLQGEGVVGVLSTSGDRALNTIRPGTSTFIARGDAHFIENTGDETLTLLIGFSDPQPEHLSVSQAFPWVPAAVMEQVLDVPPGTLPAFPPRGDLAIVPQVGSSSTVDGGAPAPFSAALDVLPTSEFAGGTVQALHPAAVATLAEMTLLRLVIDPGAVREPHWHGNAGEFNFCVSGAGQIGIVAPSGESWTFVVNTGDVAFIPNNWFHYIANIGDEPLELIAFFDDVAPSRIDLSTMTNFFPPGVLAASLDVTPETFADLPDQGTVVIAASSDDDVVATPAP